MNEFNVKLDVPQNTFQLMVLGDTHIGDELCDLELIKDTIDYVKKTKDCYVILNGDLINNALKTSKSDSYKEQMTIEEEQDLLIDLLKPIKDKILSRLNHTPINIEDFSIDLQIPINILNSQLIELEMDGKVVVENGFVSIKD